MNKTTLAVRLFDIFQNSLDTLFSGDRDLLALPRNRIALVHRLAHYMEEGLAARPVAGCEDFSWDIMLGGTDILLHDRKGKILFSLMLFRDYIPRSGTDILKKTHTEGAALTLAVAILPGKDYVLIYRVGTETIDYYHWSTVEKDAQLRMQKVRGDRKDQLQLIRAPRRRKKKGKN